MQLFKNVFASGMITLIILKEEFDDIMEIIKYLEESELLTKGVLVKQLKRKQKNKEVNLLACY